MAEQYDAIVIGGGQAGVPLAGALARSGRKTAVIEREHMGGTCINEGCTPTKTMVASARAAYMARRAADYGVMAGGVSVDMGRVRQRKRDIVRDFRGSNERRVSNVDNLDWLAGEASFTGHKTIEVRCNDGDVRRLSAEQFFINTGARPSVPKLDGLDGVPFLNSTTIMELDAVPPHLLVLGGGYVGLEFGQMFRRFGSEVTIIQRSGQLLGREDADVAEAVADILREDGVEVLLNTSALRVEGSAGNIRLTVKTPDGERTLVGSHLLAAVGRAPNTEALKPEASGIQLDKSGHIPANARLETNVPGIYALGDVKGGPAFTHISYDDFRIIRANVIEGGNATIEGRLVPYVVFMDPQLGRIGITETEAREQGRNIRVAKIPMNYISRAVEVDEQRGFMKAVVDADTGQILGGAILGLEGGELMAQLEIAMLGKLHYRVLKDAIFAHPTLSEAWNALFSQL